MPAVLAPHSKTWPKTAQSVRSAIKRRKITFADFLREIGEEARYQAIRQNIQKGRPPTGNAGGLRVVAKVEKWLNKNGIKSTISTRKPKTT